VPDDSISDLVIAGISADYFLVCPVNPNMILKNYDTFDVNFYLDRSE